MVFNATFNNISVMSWQSVLLVKEIGVQLTLVISNSMGPWKKFESTVVRLKRSYENTGSVVCLTTEGRQLEQNFEELKPASHVSKRFKTYSMFLLLFFFC